MVTSEKLYAATDDGLDILALHYSEVREAARSKKPFKARPDERTPSTSVKLFKVKQGYSVWKITDFGDEGRATDPIAVHMKETGLRFPEAILDLAQIFNVTDEINRAVNRPDIRKQPAKPEQVDGETYWEIDQEFTKEECRVMGPRVTSEHLKALHWYRVKVLISVRNREAVYKYSNEHYPIFMRECWFTDSAGKRDRFYKIYEPLNADKQWRFQYQPKGKKPQSYVNGLFELAAQWTEFNEREEKSFNRDPMNEDKAYKEQKLPEAVICSGERDALCVRALGYHPLWFNSETYRVSEEEWRQINKYVSVVYNIPDIDSTGRTKGTELALKFIDVHTIWLPEKLSSYRDNRGKPRKDFRDWAEIWNSNSDFQRLLSLATPARFWTQKPMKEDGRFKYSMDIVCLYEFLRLNGFWTLKDAHAKEVVFIKIDGVVVKRVEAKDIRRFVYDWSVDTGLPRELRCLILSTPMLSASALEALPTRELDFDCYTATTQSFFFPRFAVEVSADGINKQEIGRAGGGKYVWDTDVIPHDINILPEMFRITRDPESYASDAFDIEVLPHGSNYFRYLINSSRLHWSHELEELTAGLSPEEKEEYLKAHKFDISGPLLDDAERREQKQCLINKIFTIGYLLHRYKSDSRPWAPFVMDNVIGENDQCNGGSGKSFMLRSLRHLSKWLKLSGRNTKILDGQFPFEQIDKSTGIVVVDDCDEYFPFKPFYDNITSDITINAKNVSAYNLSFADSPKFAFTTNYVPKEFDPSTVRRMLFVVCSDYYHTASPDNSYAETRTIASDFGKNLFSESYTEAEWEADINFFLRCVEFYLSVSHLPVKIEPDMTNIIFRKYLRDMGDNFRDWAELYFSEKTAEGGGEHLDCIIYREDMMNDCLTYTRNAKMTPQRFMKQLTGFCYTCDWVDSLNPEEMRNNGSRITRRRENPVTHKYETKEVIYVRSKAEAERLRNPPPAPPVQEEMPF